MIVAVVVVGLVLRVEASSWHGMAWHGMAALLTDCDPAVLPLYGDEDRDCGGEADRPATVGL